jgi:platelet-activating factor acetylhydrolase IB subunit beta/gamma
LPPRGERPNPLREKIAQINQIVAEEINAISNAQFFTVEPSLFVNAEGSISPQDMHDYLHFTKSGYQKLAEPLLEEIQTLLKNFMQADVASVGDVDTN